MFINTWAIHIQHYADHDKPQLEIVFTYGSFTSPYVVVHPTYSHES